MPAFKWKLSIGFLAVLSLRVFQPYPCQAEDSGGALSAHSEEPDRSSAATLTGDWGGIRSSLESKGLTVESALFTDLVANVSGGVKRSAVVLGTYDLNATLDTEKAGLWDGGSLVTYLVAAFGDAPHKSVGDYQYTDNLDVYSTVSLYEFFYEHSFLEGKLRLLAGIHDYNMDFYCINYGLELINSSFGLGPEIYQVLPPVFNPTAVGIRAKIHPSRSSYGMVAAYDGVPGDPNNPHGTHIRFDSGDGIFWGSELGVQRAEEDSTTRYYKIGVGFWHHTKDFKDFLGESRNRNHGVYLLAEAMVLREDEASEQGIGIFAAYGTAKPSVNQLGRGIIAGIRYQGLLPERDDDVLALGYARAENSDEFMEASSDSHRAETALELTYSAQILPYLKLQPDLQYVINPSMSRMIDDALVLGLRLTVDL